jgi:transcriptional regulator with XRE-family HTH domain
MSDIDEYLLHRERMLRGDMARQRIIAGLSRAEVGERMGVSARTVERIEEGGTDPRLSTLRRYCLAVGIVIGWEVLVPKGDPRAVEEAPEMNGDPST